MAGGGGIRQPNSLDRYKWCEEKSNQIQQRAYLGSNPEKCNPLNPFVISYSIVHKFSVFGKFWDCSILL